MTKSKFDKLAKKYSQASSLDEIKALKGEMRDAVKKLFEFADKYDLACEIMVYCSDWDELSFDYYLQYDGRSKEVTDRDLKEYVEDSIQAASKWIYMDKQALKKEAVDALMDELRRHFKDCVQHTIYELAEENAKTAKKMIKSLMRASVQNAVDNLVNKEINYRFQQKIDEICALNKATPRIVEQLESKLRKTESRLEVVAVLVDQIIKGKTDALREWQINNESNP